MEVNNKNCLSCIHTIVCYARRQMFENLTRLWDFDSPGSSAKLDQLHQDLASRCNHFIQSTETKNQD